VGSWNHIGIVRLGPTGLVALLGILGGRILATPGWTGSSAGALFWPISNMTTDPAWSGVVHLNVQRLGRAECDAPLLSLRLLRLLRGCAPTSVRFSGFGRWRESGPWGCSQWLASDGGGSGASRFVSGSRMRRLSLNHELLPTPGPRQVRGCVGRPGVAELGRSTQKTTIPKRSESHVRKQCSGMYLAVLLASSIDSASLSAVAQGTIDFRTLITGILDARVVLSEQDKIVGFPGADYVGQLYLGTAGSELSAIGQPVPFRDSPSAGRGYIKGGILAVPGLPPGTIVSVQLRAWRNDLGATFEQAEAAIPGFYAASSGAFSVSLGANCDPVCGAPLLGLIGYAIPVPEPTTLHLILVGSIVLAIRRTM
jgi:hypothetical protein